MEVDRLYPEPIVGAIILNNNQEILLLQSEKWDSLYCIPGGHIELGESAVEALKREVFEETGLSISDISFLGVQESIFPKEFHEKKHFIFINYCCWTKSEEVTLNYESKAYIWIKPSQIEKIELVSTSKTVISSYLKNIT